MKPTIEHPKVFISYAWGTQEYQERVVALANDLQTDGIEVLLDKWNLKEGHDTYAYMEQSVKAPDVTNVLLLLDPIYAKKADERSGGVGTETQIISPEIYNKVTQEKFIPIVMERGIDGSIPKPIYLRTLLHFDLSEIDRYDDEYQKLVKRLYGIQVYVRPELGNMPKWVTEDIQLSSSKRTAIHSIKNSNNPRKARTDFIELLNSLKSRVIAFDYQEDDYIHLYERMIPLREEYLQALKTSIVIENSHTIIGDFLQELYDEIDTPSMIQQDIKKLFLHEIFIYTIAILYKAKEYSTLQYLLNKSFFGKKYAHAYQDTGFIIFYHNSEIMDVVKKERDNQQYFSGTARIWIDNIAVDYCNKKEFVFADVLLSNYSQFGANYEGNWPWFAITYVYDRNQNTILQSVATQLRSKEIALRWAIIFGYDDISNFRLKISKTAEELKLHTRNRLRYSQSFEEVQLLSDFIKPEEIGIIN